MEHHTTESREPRGVEEAGCKTSSGAPTVRQTTGQVKVKVKVKQAAPTGKVGFRDGSSKVILSAATLR